MTSIAIIGEKSNIPVPKELLARSFLKGDRIGSVRPNIVLVIGFPYPGLIQERIILIKINSSIILKKYLRETLSTQLNCPIIDLLIMNTASYAYFCRLNTILSLSSSFKCSEI